ncbi:zinc finger protein 197 isoform X2 [Eurytemora carolleeae]|uniref:zinc finger protein 197 isoform X2 n=1 Tax=Eurytemora carolleeae TaxID=1294199 RepID=UPI000C77A597|nr:zinc finger protein 197 isoform X2 [Eurytemora carolleeae]|eukprot:XP_023333502.1 zinc finger protein 197-like isoform X2 [Eurytemora affinis]
MHVSDKMPGTMKKKLKIVQDLKITSPAVEDTCFVNKPEDEIKLTNTGIQGEIFVRGLDPLPSEPKLNRIKKSIEDGYSCSQCEYFATEYSNLKKHIKSKHEGYSCSHCDYSASTASNLRIHVESKHEGARYLCPNCEYIASTASYLKIHIKNKHEGVRYPCPHCEYIASTASYLKIHIKNKHEGVRYPCPDCEYIASTASNLKIHIKNKHEGVRYPCSQCNYAASLPHHLKRHVENKHEGLRYLCPDCNFSTARTEYMHKHIEFKHKGVRYPCPECEFVANFAITLKTHVENKHNGVRYPCPQCEYAATTAGDRKKHVESQHEGVRYLCSQCDFIASFASKLKSHVENKHNGVRYPFPQCEYVATTADARKTHVKSQHDGVRYPCSQCNYAAVQPYLLKRHVENKHEGVRYPCPQCDFVANFARTLKTHVENKHNGVRYPCSQCNYAAIQPYLLKSHECTESRSAKQKSSLSAPTLVGEGFSSDGENGSRRKGEKEKGKNLDFMNENADSSVFNPETSTPCLKGKKSSQQTVQHTLQPALHEQRKKIQNNSNTLYKYQFQNIHKNKLLAEINLKDVSMKSKSERQNNPFPDRIKTLGELEELEDKLQDAGFFSQCLNCLGENLEGSTIQNTAYRLLPKIMEKEFLLDVSWTNGFGKNKTKKSVILTEFPKMVNLILGVINGSERWYSDFKADPLSSQRSLTNGLSQYLRNLVYNSKNKTSRSSSLSEDERKKPRLEYPNKLIRAGGDSAVNPSAGSSARPTTDVRSESENWKEVYISNEQRKPKNWNRVGAGATGPFHSNCHSWKEAHISKEGMKSFKTNRVGARAAGPFQDVWKPEPQDQLTSEQPVNQPQLDDDLESSYQIKRPMAIQSTCPTNYMPSNLSQQYEDRDLHLLRKRENYHWNREFNPRHHQGEIRGPLAELRGFGTSQNEQRYHKAP